MLPLAAEVKQMCIRDRYGFAESVYCRAMAIALMQSGLQVGSEIAVPVSFRGENVGVFRCDLMVERKIILELKIAD